MNNSSWVEENYSIPEDITNVYNIEVEHPSHIPLIVEAVSRTAEEEPVAAGLNHQEERYANEFPGEKYEGKHVMRGVNEQLSSNLEPGMDIFKRPDSGQTVYTDDSKFCEILGIPFEDQNQKKASKLTDWYLEDLQDDIEMLEEASRIRPQKRDLYSGKNQIISTATKPGEKSVTTRGYWAEEMPEVYSLMFRDGATWGEIMRHRENMKESKRVLGVNNFYEKRMDNYDTEDMTSKEFLEENLDLTDVELPYTLLEENNGIPRKICFA
ncbi:MAG: hypothetical protein BRC26_03540 [Nanohaloarchaea archaeon QH_8_44_6]|nr:MAG: hypothetical protein BRC26_03540 [Nanohaloarchaea archaeon QH_8_44_6]